MKYAVCVILFATVLLGQGRPLPAPFVTAGTPASSSVTVNGQTCTIGGSCTVTAVPSGAAGGGLGGTYPNPTVSGGASSPNIGVIVRPVPADFSWINQGTATLSTLGSGLSIIAPAVAGTQVRAQVASAPATPWACIGSIAVLLTAGDSRAGLFLRESATGKMLSISGGGGSIGALLIDTWNSATSFAGTLTTYAGTTPFFPNGLWIRGRFDASDIFFDISPDGRNWSQVFTQAATTFFTVGPNQCGIGADTEHSGLPDVINTLLSFSF